MPEKIVQRNCERRSQRKRHRLRRNAPRPCDSERRQRDREDKQAQTFARGLSMRQAEAGDEQNARQRKGGRLGTDRKQTENGGDDGNRSFAKAPNEAERRGEEKSSGDKILALRNPLN